MYKKVLSILAAALFIAAPVRAQLRPVPYQPFKIPGTNLEIHFAYRYPVQYRPPHLHWQQLSTAHFNIVFPQGEDSAAYQTAHILEKQYPSVQQLTGGGLSNFPVILNDYNDLSNGFVTSQHFRSEIILSPSKGKTMSPVNGGWLENVVPHELTHAGQFSHFGEIGLGRLVYIFSPDIARTMHAFPPSGTQEGLAVYHESRGVVPGGGRGHYPFFINQFKAVFNSPERWSMGQMVQAPAYTRPFGRHYIGGYAFTHWLQSTYGAKATRDAIDFHIRWPFLGYGIALKYATGRWPWQLYHQFVRDKEQQFNQGEHHSAQKYTPLPIPYNGSEIRRPKWLSDSTLIFYGSFYNAKPGFYRYALSDHSMQRLITTGSVSGYSYTLSADRHTLIYSYDKADLIYPDAFKATLAVVALPNGKPHTIHRHSRLFAPVFTSDSTLLALKTYHATTQLVSAALADTTNQLPNTLFSNPGDQVISAAVQPQNSDSLAVVMNRHGNQALWIASNDNLERELTGAPAISFANGSVYDPVWRPDGQRLLFSADFSGTLQVYEYDLQSGAITQLTDAPYNAFEASYSPDGGRIAFVVQKGNERLPAVLSRDDFYGKAITPERPESTAPGLKVSSTKKPSWKETSYQTSADWLKPRTVIPVIKKLSGSNRYRFGAGIFSSDLLEEQAYSLESTIAKGHLWYDGTYQNKQFFPGFKLHLFSKPTLRKFKFKARNGAAFSQTFLQQERSFGISVPMQFTLRQNVYNTRFSIEPGIRESQIRYFDRNGSNPAPPSHTAIGNISMQFDYRLRENIRSVQPNSGLIIFSELEHYFNTLNPLLYTKAGKVRLPMARPTALHGGLIGYIAPLGRWNQSLRIGLKGITQTALNFNNQVVVSDAFSKPVFPFAHNLLSLSGRYTIPLFYPDNGFLLVPLYVSSVYLAAFSDTVVDPSNGFNHSRTVLGGGLRVQFRLSNLTFDVGVGIGFEPARNKVRIFAGPF